MEKIEELHGVKIPGRLQEDRNQALLYAAGFICASERREEDPPIPGEIMGVMERYGAPSSHDNVCDAALAGYLDGFIAGGGSLGSKPLDSVRRPKRGWAGKKE